jgi:hypothetical protein
MSSIDANCGQADRQASAAPSGGTPPYTYIWDDTGGQSNATVTGLSAGTYQVVVEDAIGCVDTGNVVVGNVAGGVALIAGSNNATCFGICDGDATATIAGGIAPYTYGWDDPGAELLL